MNNKKGFTLVELLTTIIVLAIVFAISIPLTFNIIEGIRKSALESTVKGLLESANIYYSQHMDKIKDPIEFVVTNGRQEGKEKLDYNGKVENAYLMLFKNNDKAVCADDGKYAASKGINDKKITVQEGNCMGYDEAYKGYIVGDTNGFTSLNIKAITDASQLGIGKQNYIRVVTETSITGFYVSATAPETPSHGMVWVVQANNSPYYLESDNVRIGVSYVMQYENNKWILKKAYVYNKDEWKLLYYVDMTDGNLNLENSNLGDLELEKNYEYTGEYQEFTAPFSGYYNIQLWGAAGGTVNGVSAGKGAYTKGNIFLNANETIYIYVGSSTNNTLGGWNGGGNGATAVHGNGSGGGGATDIRLTKTTSKTTWNEFNSLKSRIMVAAGGTGGSNYDGSTWWNNGGDGGTLEGIISSNGGSNSKEWSGTVATQTSGGFTTISYSGANGGFGYGGNSYPGYSSGGGGSGYYGGSGGAHASGLISGGSSYISGYIGCNSISKESKLDNIIHTGSVYHYSGYYFIESEMKSAVNNSNGRAIISLLSIEYKDEQQLENEKEIFEYNFTYSGTTISNGNYQEFIVPKSGTYQFELWGAAGGTVNGVSAGKGAYTKGDIYLEKEQKLYIYVGSSPINNVIGGQTGGYNGGGNGATAVHGNGSGGGGATDIRLVSNTKEWNEFDSLKSRIMVAAGGAGGSNYDGSTWWNNGGDGGTLEGIIGSGGSSSTAYYSTTATQTSGGITHVTYPGTNGGFGYGGNGYTGYTSAGAGSGYFGGGGGAHAGGILSGGSSYISGYDGCSSIEKSSTENNIISNGDKYHYSGYYFDNVVMKAGQNTGSGKVKISFKNSNNTLRQKSIVNYNYYYATTDRNVGKYQLFTVLKTGYYRFQLWGAAGGTVNGVNSGKGGYTSGEIYLTQGTKLYIYVGGTITSNTLVGGWNGGGTGATAVHGNGSGGGGATDIRIVPTKSLSIWNDISSLKSRIMVAGGGSGGSNYDGSVWWNNGGAAGGLSGILGTGGSSSNAYPSTVSTQILGGNTHTTYPGTNGGFGYGGNGYTGYSSAGAGSGWYGGGGGAHAGGILSGGSSYISGHPGCIAVTSSGTPKVQEYSNLSDSVSYTNYKFVNTQMIDGNGYPWTTVKSASSSGMPSPTSPSLITGNSGDGFARITYLGED